MIFGNEGVVGFGIAGLARLGFRFGRGIGSLIVTGRGDKLEGQFCRCRVEGAFGGVLAKTPSVRMWGNALTYTPSGRSGAHVRMILVAAAPEAVGVSPY